MTDSSFVIDKLVVIRRGEAEEGVNAVHKVLVSVAATIRMIHRVILESPWYRVKTVCLVSNRDYAITQVQERVGRKEVCRYIPRCAITQKEEIGLFRAAVDFDWPQTVRHQVG